MADLLTHVLVGYVVGTLLSFRYDRLRPAHVSLVMIGAAVPDLNRIQLLLPEEFVAWRLGLPFSWGPVHVLVGSVLVSCLLALLVASNWRRLALVLLIVGVLTHHVLDVVLITTTGESYAVFWPLLEYRLPSGDLYLSVERWPALVAGACAALLWAIERRRGDTAAETSSTTD